MSRTPETHHNSADRSETPQDVFLPFLREILTTAKEQITKLLQQFPVLVSAGVAEIRKLAGGNDKEAN